MARYIDADAIHKFVDEKVTEGKDGWSKGVPYEWAYALTIIDQAPTADVVPNSEVDKLIYKLECFLCHATGNRLSKHTYDLGTMETVATDYINETYNDGYGEGYKNCAWEIFEEIERVIGEKYNHYVFGNNDLDSIEQDAIINFSDSLTDCFTKLKKKYTEVIKNE